MSILHTGIYYIELLYNNAYIILKSAVDAVRYSLFSYTLLIAVRRIEENVDESRRCDL